jgi:hypothetical protein
VRFKSLTIGSVILVAFSTMATGCPPPPPMDYEPLWGTAIQSWTGEDPGFAPEAESSLVPSMDSIAPTVCTYVPSQVEGRRDLCRVLEGVEELNDHRNWLVFITLDGHPAAIPGPASSYNSEGWSFTTSEGTTFEGCRNAHIYSPVMGLKMMCDYRSVHPFVASEQVSHGFQMTYMLDKLWHWGRYSMKPEVGCAASMLGLIKNAGLLITGKFLLDCTDTPWDGS